MTEIFYLNFWVSHLKFWFGDKLCLILRHSTNEDLSEFTATLIFGLLKNNISAFLTNHQKTSPKQVQNVEHTVPEANQFERMVHERKNELEGFEGFTVLEPVNPSFRNSISFGKLLCVQGGHVHQQILQNDHNTSPQLY